MPRDKIKLKPMISLTTSSEAPKIQIIILLFLKPSIQIHMKNPEQFISVSKKKLNLHFGSMKSKPFIRNYIGISCPFSSKIKPKNSIVRMFKIPEQQSQNLDQQVPMKIY